ncbi:MAG: hypothetical protein LBK73_03655 [Treponema sp.]|jgi:hypothetical protein|nr:hypothetical protein [Treponema sp.]
MNILSFVIPNPILVRGKEESGKSEIVAECGDLYLIKQPESAGRADFASKNGVRQPCWQKIINAGDCIVVSPNYRRSVDFPFPEYQLSFKRI